ncbi:MAG: hypothetical protein JKY61_12830 [Planctomycetes bacterium]|nr:hypothetical protein [Planctomycetota bacterium]
MGLPQGADCSNPTAISGTGTYAYDLTTADDSGPFTIGCAPALFQDGVDAYFAWTCPGPGDYTFAGGAALLDLFTGSDCNATERGSINNIPQGRYVIGGLATGDQILIRCYVLPSWTPAQGILSIGTIAEPCAGVSPDAFEGNDSIATASLLAPGTYSNLNVSMGDPDYYRFQIPPGHLARLDGGIRRVLQSNCMQSFSFTAHGWEHVNRSSIPVTFTAVVDLPQTGLNSGPGSCNTYEMTLQILPDPCQNGTDDSFEPNQSCAAATPLSQGVLLDLTVRASDADYFSFTVPQGVTAQVRPIGFVNVELLDASCNAIPNSSGFYTNSGSAPVQVFALVTPLPSTGCNNYSLSLDYIFFGCNSLLDDELEENDTRATSVPISNGAFTLFVSNSDPDFYDICVLAGQTVEIQMTYSDLTVDLSMALSNAPGASLAGNFGSLRATYSNNTGSTTTVGLGITASNLLEPCGIYNLTIDGAVSCGFDTLAFCDPASNNSTGSPTRIVGSQTPNAASTLHLECLSGPPNQFGYFLVASDFQDPGLPIGQGSFCLLISQFGRYNVAGSPLNSVGAFGVSGVMQNLVGSSTTGTGFDVPAFVPNTGLPILVGSTWHFQVWHRDVGGTTNFSNGLSVTF